MKKIVVINGSGGVGKDAVVDIAAKYFDVERFSSVEKIKQIAKELGWDGGKTEKDRKFLSDLKNLTTEYNNLPFKEISKKIEQFKKNDFSILFIFVREPEEINKIVDHFEAKTLLVRNNKIPKIETNNADKEVENYNYDYIIENNGTLEELNDKVFFYITALMGR